MTRYSILPVFAILCLSGLGASAAPITGLGLPLNDPQLVGGVTIDFESVPTGQFSSLTVESVTFATQGSERGYVSNAYSGNYNVLGNSMQNTYAANAFRVLNISFASPVDAFAFNFGASDVEWVLRAFDTGNNLLGSQTLPILDNSNAGNYFGIAAVGISLVTLTQNGGGDYIFVDNFAYREAAAAVPEPASVLAWTCVGIAALLIARRGRRDVLKR